jgi:acetyl esterase
VTGACRSPKVVVRIYAPTDRTGLLPGPPCLQGSAFVPGSRIADRTVIAVDRRMAPEHPTPAAFDDSLAALQCATSPQAAAYGADPGQAAVIGENA